MKILTIDELSKIKRELKDELEKVQIQITNIRKKESAKRKDDDLIDNIKHRAIPLYYQLLKRFFVTEMDSEIVQIFLFGNPSEINLRDFKKYYEDFVILAKKYNLKSIPSAEDHPNFNQLIKYIHPEPDDKCMCNCHVENTRHIGHCCNPCAQCDKNIRLGMREMHYIWHDRIDEASLEDID